MKKKILFFSICLIILVSFIYILYVYNFIPHKAYDNDYFNIETYISEVDKDSDGIDDQTDMLMGVKDYIKTNPKYKSKYYGTGYPDDEYGVCTDVVANGLTAAGYDIRMLLYEDVKNNRDDYDINTIDKNIDFRRVNNLNVYFKRNAISLTTDVDKKEEWQGGDIVVFKKHIGIVSDKRNKKGIPFVIHHASPYQGNYEEDILGTRDDIVAHYRIS